MALELSSSKSASWKASLDAFVGEIATEIIDLRRYLHAHPEPSGAELHTSLHLYQLLGRLELDVRMGPEGCGVVAENKSDAATRVAIRGDIDALLIQDEKTVDYRSTNPGVMHACGHDAHTSIAYGTVRTLVTLEERGELPWPVAWRAIFQPAEETALGAARMVDAGALTNVTSAFSLHVDPSRRTGVIGLRSGAMTASCDTVHLTVQGQGGHAARPHESRDPIAASAQLINALYQYIPRTTETHEAVVLTIGHIRGGENPNVIPSSVDLWGTLRTLDSTVRARIIEKIRQVAAGIGEVTDTQIELALDVSVPCVNNDATLTRLVWQEAEDVVGTDHVQLIARPSMGSEDFACYLQTVPGVMFRLGCSDDLASAKGLHTPNFDIDERALAIGIRILTRAAIMASQPGGAGSG